MVHNRSLSAKAYVIGVLITAVVFAFGYYVRGKDNFADARNHELYRMNNTLVKIEEKLPQQKVVTVTETKNVYKDAAIRNRGLYINQNGIMYDPPNDADMMFDSGCISWKGGTFSPVDNPLNQTTITGTINICGKYKLVFTEQAYCGDILYCTKR